VVAWQLGIKPEAALVDQRSTLLPNHEIHFIINTPSTHESRADEILIREYHV
jgi:hypothetical protein